MNNIAEYKLKAYIFWGSFSLIALIYSYFFSHSDLNHTAISSFAILNGHIQDFYEYNKIKLGGNDYLPLMYWVFAIWNLVFCKLLICEFDNVLTIYGLIVQKILLAFLYLTSIYVLNKIVREVDKSDGYGDGVTLFYASSVVMLFCVFGFNQYDIIGILFSLLGIYFYVRNDILKFSILFSLAISIKYFAVIAFIPFLLIREKNFLKIIVFIFIGGIATLAQVWFYQDSSIFMSSFYSLAFKKTYGQVDNYRLIGGIALAVFYISILFVCWRFKGRNNKSELKIAIIATASTYLLIYLRVDWHPQWISIIIPYLALSLIYSKFTYLNIIFQISLGVCYILLVVSRYPNNLDTLMLGSGIARDYFGNSHIAIVSIYKDINFNLVNWIFYISIFYFIFSALISDAKVKSKYYLQVIVIWITNSIFLVPALFIAFSSSNLLSKYDSAANLRNRNVERFLNSGNGGEYLGGFGVGSKISQNFKPKRSKLIAISLNFGTYNMTSNSKIKLEISDKNGSFYSDLLDFRYIYPNVLTYIKNINAGNRCHHGCIISMDVISGDSPLQVWYEKNKTPSGDKHFYINNKMIDGTFIIEEFYEK